MRRSGQTGANPAELQHDEPSARLVLGLLSKASDRPARGRTRLGYKSNKFLTSRICAARHAVRATRGPKWGHDLGWNWWLGFILALESES